MRTGWQRHQPSSGTRDTGGGRRFRVTPSHSIVDRKALLVDSAHEEANELLTAIQHKMLAQVRGHQSRSEHVRAFFRYSGCNRRAPSSTGFFLLSVCALKSGDIRKLFVFAINFFFNFMKATQPAAPESTSLKRKLEKILQEDSHDDAV